METRDTVLSHDSWTYHRRRDSPGATPCPRLVRSLRYSVLSEAEGSRYEPHVGTGSVRRRVPTRDIPAALTVGVSSRIHLFLKVSLFIARTTRKSVHTDFIANLSTHSYLSE